jgi:hypothetical protein
MAVFADVLMCGCGYVLWGEELEELCQDAEQHVRDVNPELIGTLSPLELARPLSEDEAPA